VTRPRLPCYKLGIKFGQADMVKRFSNSGRTGFYVAVRKDGEVGAGDPSNCSAATNITSY
jgi:MOSC domain-containing protein YiiM